MAGGMSTRSDLDSVHLVTRPRSNRQGDPMKTIGLALVLAVAACGNGRDDAHLSSPPASGPEATPQTVAVRLLGVGAPGPVRVRGASLGLSVDGPTLPARLEGGE